MRKKILVAGQIEDHAENIVEWALLVILPVITALLFYAVCAGLLQVINVDKDNVICISESVSGISGIVSYVVTAFWLVRSM